MGQWAEKTGCLRPQGGRVAANRRYKATDEPNKTLSAILAGASGIKTGNAVVWGGIEAFKSVASIGTNPVVQEKILSLETEIQKVPALVKVGCWGTVKSLMNVEVWIEKPIAENYNSMKSACLNE